MVLPLIPRNIERTIENIIREFLWNGKKAKIAYNILQNPKLAGGLELVNLKNKDISLKATWPMILHKEEEYAVLVYKIMHCETIKEDIWRCNLSPEDATKMKFRNHFGKDVLWS